MKFGTMKQRVFSRLGIISFLIATYSLLTYSQAGIVRLEDRATFERGLSKQTKIDFENLVPNSGFRNYKMPDGLTINGVSLQTTGGGRFGPSALSVVGGWYYAGPAYETTTGAKITWSPPNQPGNAYLEVRLPAEVTAVGADLWTVQPALGSVEVLLTSSDGQTQSATVATAQRPAATFIGFTSLAPISSIRFSIPQGQTGLILDNFTFGQSTAKQQSIASTAQSREDEDRRPVATSSKSSTSTVNSERSSQLTGTTSARGGTIAYIRNGTEIRLIEPDGSNDRRLWTHPDASKDLGIGSLAWRPDGQELAFSSSHAAVASLYDADLYAIRPDGKGYRKLTNAPDRGEYSGYPKGSVSVTVRNDQPTYKQSQASSGVFIVQVRRFSSITSLTSGITHSLLSQCGASFAGSFQGWMFKQAEPRRRQYSVSPVMELNCSERSVRFGALTDHALATVRGSAR
jgi:hypothetical protein